MSARTICIVGEPGSGKTTAFRNLDPKETFIISISGKPLSFKGWKKMYTPLTVKNEKNVVTYSGNYYVSDQYDKIINVLNLINLKLTQYKNIIIDK